MNLKILFLALMFLSANVFSANVNIVATPTSWKLQNYVGDIVIVYHTGSPCTSGRMKFGSNATADDKNKFWSLIMAGKISGKQVQVYFEDSGAPDNCLITSFSLMQE